MSDRTMLIAPSYEVASGWATRHGLGPHGQSWAYLGKAVQLERLEPRPGLRIIRLPGRLRNQMYPAIDAFKARGGRVEAAGV